MNLIFFDIPETRTSLLPFTFTRPVADIRPGILTIREKWQKRLGILNSSSITEDYLSAKFPLTAQDINLVVNGSFLPEEELDRMLMLTNENELLRIGDQVIGGRVSREKLEYIRNGNWEQFSFIDYPGEVRQIVNLWDIFSTADREIRNDIELLTKGKASQPLPASNRVIGDASRIFLEQGAVVEGATLNTKSGPIYIGHHAEVMEGSLIRGPFGLGDHAAVKMGAKIYGPSAFGPFSKVGGEVNNSIIFGYSSKAHDGFLGNSVLGEWCNLGADSNNSNLKNNYAEVKLWHYGKKSFVKTGLQFCGLIMGDHSKCGINTMFNTGTVVGVSANIFGSGFPRNFIPSFSWGGAAAMTTYQVETAIETAKLVYERRGLPFDETEQEIFRTVFTLTKENRGS
jgi:UDP-N-acetylglucosamine diphosphorylase/glucosamine-1-phosphate N-acetyltransferase